jgi:hypothetical protein
VGETYGANVSTGSSSGASVTSSGCSMSSSSTTDLRRPHRGRHLDTQAGPPVPDSPAVHGRVRRRDLLGGLVHEYEAAA